MKKIPLLFSLVLCVVFSSAALADQRHSRRAPSAQAGHSMHRTVIDHRRPAHSSSMIVYRSAPVVYRSAPVVVYQQPTVIYREPVVVYQEPAVVYSEPTVIYEDAPIISGEARGDSAAARIVGAIAGGVIGSRFGGGNGRLATTAAGAVLGSIIAGELAR
ncbi:MAG: glycine zipper 2TM domain-containing protein [Zoogloeaceae bacterium]|nr:glycine zipper 2TM domain-containing protein [Zoogloeaceae bacterium]